MKINSMTFRDLFIAIAVGLIVGCAYIEVDKGVPECGLVLGSIEEECIPRDYQVFNSEGGDVHAGMRIIEYGIEHAHVYNLCGSMCIPMVVTAEYRTACGSARFRFHMAGEKNPETGKLIPSQWGNSVIMGIITRSTRVDIKKFTELWYSAQPGKENFTEVTAYEMFQHGMLDHLSFC